MPSSRQRCRAGSDRHPDRAARGPHAQAGTGATDQRSIAHRRDARPRRPLQDPRDRVRAYHLRRDESSVRTRSRRVNGDNSRHDRRARPLFGDLHREERRRVGVEAIYVRRRGTARAHAGDGMEQLECLWSRGERFTRPCRCRRDGGEGPHRSRLDLRQPRRRLGAERARDPIRCSRGPCVLQTARCSRTRNSRR